MTMARTQSLNTLSAAVWALRADGVPLNDILDAAREANRQWEPSSQAAFVVEDEDDHYTGNVGKRLSTSDPLTEHDIAERLEKAIMRVLRIMMDTRVNLGLMRPVKHSRYLTNSITLLAEELHEWGVSP